MNYNVHIAAEKHIKASEAEFQELEELLTDEYEACGFSLSYNAGELFLFAESDGRAHDLPEPFLIALGKLIANSNLPFLQLGVAWTASRFAEMTFGGTTFRIYPDGALEYPTLVWEHEERLRASKTESATEVSQEAAQLFLQGLPTRRHPTPEPTLNEEEIARGTRKLLISFIPSETTVETLMYFLENGRFIEGAAVDSLKMHDSSAGDLLDDLPEIWQERFTHDETTEDTSAHIAVLLAISPEAFDKVAAKIHTIFDSLEYVFVDGEEFD